MPTKLKRYAISVEADLDRMLVKESKWEHIPIATLVVRHLYEHYRQLKGQVEFVDQLRGDELAVAEPTVFVTPPDVGAPAKSRKNARQANSE